MLELSLLGPMTVRVDGVARPLPPSRKTRLLLAYLALEPRVHQRQRLCELLWDIPDDPRAALRWSLAKLRPLLDRPDRLRTTRETVAFEADGAVVDVTDLLAAAAGHGPPPADLPTGRFLEDSDLPDLPEVQGWILTMRQRVQEAQLALGRRLLGGVGPAVDRLGLVDRLLALAPLDADLHQQRIALLAAAGQPDAARTALAVARRQFGDAGVSPPPLALPAAPPPPGQLAAVVIEGFAAVGDPVLAPVLAGLVGDGLADRLARHASLAVTRAAPGQGTGYVVAGTVLVSGGRARIRWRLLPPEGGAPLWSGDIDRDGSDLLALDDEVAAAIAAVIEPRVRHAEVARARDEALPTPRTLFLRALGHMAGDGDFGAAAALMEAALAHDPDHAPSAAFLPWASLQAGRVTGAEARTRFADLARRAIQRQPDDAMIQAIAGLMLLLVGHDLDGGQAAIDRAAIINPDSLFAAIARGWASFHDGRDADALTAFDRAEALAAGDPNENSLDSGRAAACFQQGDLAAAAGWARRAMARSRASLEALRIAIAVAVEQGEAAEARALAADLLVRSPAERAARAHLLPYRNRRTAARLEAAWRAAGIPA